MAGNRPAKVRRKPVPDEERRAYLTEYAKAVDGQPDFIYAIVATAYIEGALITLLHNFFVKCQSRDTILENNGRLGDFSSCCQVARCLGFLNSTMLSNLQTIGEIRNAFAHNRNIDSFNHSDIKSRCLLLELPKSIKAGLEAGSIDYEKNKDLLHVRDDPAARFKKVAALMLEWIAIMADDAHRQPARQRNLDVTW
jgi:hypothetical protein